MDVWMGRDLDWIDLGEGEALPPRCLDSRVMKLDILRRTLGYLIFCSHGSEFGVGFGIQDEETFKAHIESLLEFFNAESWCDQTMQAEKMLATMALGDLFNVAS